MRVSFSTPSRSGLGLCSCWLCSQLLMLHVVARADVRTTLALRHLLRWSIALSLALAYARPPNIAQHLVAPSAVAAHTSQVPLAMETRRAFSHVHFALCMCNSLCLTLLARRTWETFWSTVFWISPLLRSCVKNHKSCAASCVQRSSR